MELIIGFIVIVLGVGVLMAVYVAVESVMNNILDE